MYSIDTSPHKPILSYYVQEWLIHQEMCAIIAEYWWRSSAITIPFWLPVFHLFKYFTLKHKTVLFIIQCFENKIMPNIVEKLQRKEKWLKELVSFMQTN
jgi:hypothetical protein